VLDPEEVLMIFLMIIINNDNDNDNNEESIIVNIFHSIFCHNNSQNE
jgi:hypothetical protein